MFGVSDKHTGPWLGEAKTAAESLAKGRAMWGNQKRLYVAKIDTLNPASRLPNVEVIISDLKETLVEEYGGGADEIFNNHDVMSALSTWWEEEVKYSMLQAIESVEKLDFMVATQIKIYSPDHSVKVGDFK